jgi:hypothetical protein
VAWPLVSTGSPLVPVKNTAPDGTRRIRRGGRGSVRIWGPLPTGHSDPAHIPHDDEERGVATGGNPEPKPQVNDRFRPGPQVARSAWTTLSRWRHGFKSRWDYAGQTAYPEVAKPVAPHWPRGVHASSRPRGVFPVDCRLRSWIASAFCHMLPFGRRASSQGTTYRREGPAARVRPVKWRTG